MQSKRAEKQRTLDRKQARALKRTTGGTLLNAFGLETESQLERALPPEIDTVRGYAQRRATRGG
jgi:hypothetical protein